MTRGNQWQSETLEVEFSITTSTVAHKEVETLPTVLALNHKGLE